LSRSNDTSKAAALAALVLTAACGGATGERPNIVILVSDDQDYEHFGFMGHPLAHTPEIDALADEGVVFTHAFVPMSRCRPAQAALLSGQWPHQNGVYFNVGPDRIDPTTCIANVLSEAGYVAAGEGMFWEQEMSRNDVASDTTLKGRLASKKIAVEEFDTDAAPGGQRLVRLPLVVGERGWGARGRAAG